ncbi:MAG: hypothetical protein ACI8Q9_001571 [Planctomycetota bacterium]|jgi:hypothetical protein
MNTTTGILALALSVSPLWVHDQEPTSQPTSRPTGEATLEVARDPVPNRGAFDLALAKDQVDAAVGAAEIAAHIQYLASDELEGRYTGSAGGKLAADYLAATLAKLEAQGMQPAGDNGTYLQDIQLSVVSFPTMPVLMADTGDGLLRQVYGTSFELTAGLEGKGELGVLAVEEPDDARLESPDLAMALYLNLSATERRDVFEKRGASWQAAWGAIIFEGTKREGREESNPARVRRVAAKLDGVSLPVTFKVKGALRESFEDGSVKRISFEVSGSQPKAYNVVGKLPATLSNAGGGPEGPPSAAAMGAIVLSAHYDHLRSRPRSEGDAEDVDLIYNGADDDASGVAAVLEIVEAAAFEQHRERDIIVLLATGEEIGLVGTTYYLDHPAVPLDKTLCNLNFEMIGRPDDAGGGFGKLWLTGYDYTNIGPDFAAKGIAVVRDPHPEMNYYQRSDNYAFVQKGIVGQSFSSYNGHKDYHHVSDEVETIDFWHMEAAVADCAKAVIMALDFGFEVKWAEGYELPRR